jgi:acetyltransferase-like isoleucine patch superfamily enzyme
VGRAREQFRRFEGVLSVAEQFVGVLPVRVRLTLLGILRDVPGRLGIAARYVVIRRCTRSCGRLVAVFETVFLRNPMRIEFGENVSIHPMCYLEGEGGLTIGSDVSIAHGVTIMTTEHEYGVTGMKMRDAPVKHAPVAIGDDVWIGAGVKILAGVTIGNHVVVGAGAVVTRDIPSNSLAVGIPARVIRNLEDQE